MRAIDNFPTSALVQRIIRYDKNSWKNSNQLK